MNVQLGTNHINHKLEKHIVLELLLKLKPNSQLAVALNETTDDAKYKPSRTGKHRGSQSRASSIRMRLINTLRRPNKPRLIATLKFALDKLQIMTHTMPSIKSQSRCAKTVNLVVFGKQKRKKKQAR